MNMKSTVKSKTHNPSKYRTYALFLVSWKSNFNLIMVSPPKSQYFGFFVEEMQK